MLSVDAFVRNVEILHEGFPVIAMRLMLPRIEYSAAPDFTSSRREHRAVRKFNRAVRRVNSFYEHMAEMLERHARRNLLANAAVLLEIQQSRSREFHPYEIEMTFTAEHVGDELTVSRVMRFCLGDGSHERRFTDVWDIRCGLLIRSTAQRSSRQEK